MTHKKVYGYFERLFPFIAKETTEWFECGKNAIRVRCSLYEEDIVFSYFGKSHWDLESLSNYILRMNERRKV